MFQPSDADREAVRRATEEAAREGRPFCVIDEWARSRAAIVLERLIGLRG
ncbi:hypothetical protein [Aquincola tertiaricarbonis]|nr:hypothetical protein [Aquincola tertiaricarbonis]